MDEEELGIIAEQIIKKIDAHAACPADENLPCGLLPSSTYMLDGDAVSKHAKKTFAFNHIA